MMLHQKKSPFQVVPREHDLQEVGVQTGQTGAGTLRDFFCGLGVKNLIGRIMAVSCQQIQWDIDI